MLNQIETTDLFGETRVVSGAISLQKWYRKKHNQLIKEDLDFQMRAAKESDPVKRAKLTKQIEASGKRLEDLNAAMRRCLLSSVLEKADRDTLIKGFEQCLMTTTEPGQVQEFITESNQENQIKMNGVAAVYDSQAEISGYFREVIAQGAFDEVLRKKPDVRLLFNHNSDNIMARTKSGSLQLSTASIGLIFWGDMLSDDSLSDAMAARIQRGDISGCSFAFTVDEDDWVLPKTASELPERTIIKIGELYDVGPVTYPAYKQTTVQVVKEPRSSDIKSHTHEGFQAYIDEFEEFEFEEFDRQYAERHRPISDERMKDIKKKYRMAGRMINRNK